MAHCRGSEAVVDIRLLLGSGRHESGMLRVMTALAWLACSGSRSVRGQVISQTIREQNREVNLYRPRGGGAPTGQCTCSGVRSTR